MSTINWSSTNNDYHLLEYNDNLHNKLEPFIYNVSFSDKTGYYLSKKKEKFDLPNTIYNVNNYDLNKLSEMFIQRYKKGKSNLNVLLLGEKGSGKSLLLKMVSNKAIDNDIPVIMINTAYNPSSLIGFLSSIKEEAVILFDEFDKKYSSTDNMGKPSQLDFLSYFDGVNFYKKLCVLTANNKNGISSYYFNRPTRLRYVLTYEKLKHEFVLDYVNKNLKYEEIKEELFNKLKQSKSLNFDLLENTVTEVNEAYPTLSLEEIISFFNLTIDGNETLTYDGTIENLNEDVLGEIKGFNIEWKQLETNNYIKVYINDFIYKVFSKLLNGSFNINTIVTYDDIKQINGKHHVKLKLEIIQNEVMRYFILNLIRSDNPANSNIYYYD